MNSSINYPIIRMNNESVIIMPGSKFTKNELKSRLHDMDIDASNVQDKGVLVNIYESSLSDNQNKLKILNRLRKDTEMYNSKLGISQRQSLQASNANTMSNNSKNKVINISYDVKPFNSKNTIQQDINMIKSINTNTSKGANSYNSYNYNNNQEQPVNNTGKFGYSDNQIENRYNNYSISNYQSNNQSKLNNSNKYNNNNYSNNNNNYSYYNNTSQISVENNNNNLMNNLSNNNMNSINSLNNVSNNNINNSSSINNMSNNYMNSKNSINDASNNNMNNRNSINNKNYQEETNNDIKRNYNYIGDSSGINNKIFTNVSTPNPQNYQQNNKNQSIFNSLINSQSTNNNNNNFNNDKNYNINNNFSFNSNNPFNQNTNNNYSRRVIIEEQNPSTLLSNGEEIQNNNYREPDEESNYSIFSTFKDFKNSYFYKNRKQICFNIVISFIILSLVIVGFYLLSSFWDILTDPRSIIEGIFGFISSLFFGSIRYFYITIPIILLIIFLIIIVKKYMFKKRCKEIFKKIVDNLIKERNSGNTICEDEIFRRYVQNFGINYEEFIKKYLPALRKMRRNDNRLKSYSERVNGKDITYWELNN